MMFVTGDIWETLYAQHNAHSDEDKEAQIRNTVRKAYYELCSRVDWDVLRTEITYDSSGDGMWLPADLAGIMAVANTENKWNKATKAGATKENIQSRMWYIDEVNYTPLVSGSDIAITNGSTSFTGGTGITTDMVGEFIRIGGQSGVYQLASVNELETPYYGDDLTAGSFEVRPIGTQKIKLSAPSGVDDTTPATIYYWKLPAQLYDASQPMLLPTSALLEIASSVKLFTITREKEQADDAKKDLYGSKGRYEGELSRAESVNPEFVMPTAPESFGGNQAGFGSRPRR
jgi:hypothetical protein